jgi:hypothetical protein
VNGPPCAAISRAAYLALDQPLAHSFRYAGARFDRAYGYAMCNIIADHGGHGAGRLTVCQFNNPSVLDVSTPRGDVLFRTDSRPATISIDHGEPHCVLNARVGLDWLLK